MVGMERDGARWRDEAPKPTCQGFPTRTGGSPLAGTQRAARSDAHHRSACQEASVQRGASGTGVHLEKCPVNSGGCVVGSIWHLYPSVQGRKTPIHRSLPYMTWPVLPQPGAASRRQTEQECASESISPAVLLGCPAGLLLGRRARTEASPGSAPRGASGGSAKGLPF